jgi:hypothetical protein
MKWTYEIPVETSCGKNFFYWFHFLGGVIDLKRGVNNSGQYSGYVIAYTVMQSPKNLDICYSV